MTIMLGRKRLKRKEGDKKKRKRAGQGETDATLSVALLLSPLNTLFVPNNLIFGTKLLFKSNSYKMGSPPPLTPIWAIYFSVFQSFR